MTDYHTQYIAYELTRRCASDQVEKLAGAVASAQVDLNPHQIDAALFAFKSPLSKGAILADEVGLGKTIEAGLVLSQKWAERKRRILIITPSNLRKQWYQELTEKFFLPCFILEAKSYNQAIKQGHLKPFEKEAIVICSYQFAKGKASDVHELPWDLVIIDEAHRLRNVYKASNVIANTLKASLAGKHKLLLTATPLQNSLAELFGLVSFIDEHVFGDINSFRAQFGNTEQSQTFRTLKARLKPVCNRTLRRQVQAYVPYTKRSPLVEEFSPEDNEDKLYNLVSAYLQRDNLYALPAAQRALMTLVLRKLLASSTFAIANALNTMTNRLKKMIQQPVADISLTETLEQDYEAFNETAEEWEEFNLEEISEQDKQAIAQEIAELEQFTKLALSIEHNAKGRALIKVLDVAFAKTQELGAAQKAIIFTESRKTQDYLLRLLVDTAFGDKIVLFNGSNTDERSRNIYQNWMAKHKDTDRVTGSRTADMRSALVDYFREHANIMIATEAAAEGINLQFCSLVINYDLPWNPQRIEQRIGRCHRYGQKHDVVVVNFLNRKNAADQRVFELLSEKFHLFEGVFGASDEVLGAIESGIDFEKRIVDIYQKCRTQEEIQNAYEALREDLSVEIQDSMAKTRQQLLENFDDEVREKLKVRDEVSRACLNRYEQALIQLTQHELKDHATFITKDSFHLHTLPFEATLEIPFGLYELPRRSGEAHFYRSNHPLAEQLIAIAKMRNLPKAELIFNYDLYEGKISILESELGQSGWLGVTLFSIDSLDQQEDYLICTTITNQGKVLDKTFGANLLKLPAQIIQESISESAPEELKYLTQQEQNHIQQNISERNLDLYQIEAEKLDAWADDLKVTLEKEIKELDRQLNEIKRQAKILPTLEEKLIAQQQIKSLETQRKQKRHSLFDAQDAIDLQRDELITLINNKLAQHTETKLLFFLKWRLK
ncbi:DEAD/DEAH box helicase [Legionella longbeachae]|nr:DEAD/DEAH box helicase [Legionella longbeachae]